jgi:putative peptidoglycan lipid II flippase
MEEKKKVLKAAGIVSSLTLFSRVTGFVRDAIIAAFFGTGMYADAFWAAFRIPNLLRRLLGEGSLNASFIPVYADVREHRGEERVREFFSNCFTLLTMLLVVLTTLGIVFAPTIVRFLVPGYAVETAKQETTILLLRIMFPYAIFVCVCALFMGVLNSRAHFFSPAFSPVLLNLGMITAAAVLVNRLDLPVKALTYGVLVGGIMQVSLQIPFLRKFDHLPRIRVNLSDPDMRRVLYLMLPALIGPSPRSGELSDLRGPPDGVAAGRICHRYRNSHFPKPRGVGGEEGP